MQHTIASLIGFKMGATDGDIGEVKEFYFDDKTWAIRYLVVETGTWFFHKKVLIAPQALLLPDWENKNFPINLTKAQIKNSPDVDTDKPISFRQEIEMYGHYAWEGYGGSGFYAGGNAAAMNLPPIVDEKIIKAKDPADDLANEDPHLRSSETVSGYHIHATDGEIGHVKDFIIDDQTWAFTKVLIDTHNWFGGKKVVIPIVNIIKIEWSTNLVFLEMSKNDIAQSQLFEEDDLPSLSIPK